ncbi:MAG TPA: hypothetical protein VJT72_21790 [Pseudonocardiaceae bacterium]|nr:hypothetical protein [Pseudonocardiaceae bacterium]
MTRRPGGYAGQALIVDVTDPYGKIPEFKSCAVQIVPLGAGSTDDGQ